MQPFPTYLPNHLGCPPHPPVREKCTQFVTLARASWGRPVGPWTRIGQLDECFAHGRVDELMDLGTLRLIDWWAHEKQFLNSVCRRGLQMPTLTGICVCRELEQRCPLLIRLKQRNIPSLVGQNLDGSERNLLSCVVTASAHTKNSVQLEV